jgi:putative transport protein
VMLIGHYLLNMSSDDLFGIVAGTTGNPAIVVYANRTVQSDRIDLAYASIYPSMTILKIILVQVAIGLLGR